MLSNNEDNLIVGFIKVRNEIIRSGNLYRALHNMQEFCSQTYAIDDASYDGTYEYLLKQLPPENIIRITPENHDFSRELWWKQKLLDLIHVAGPWNYIWWQDGDEVLDKPGTAEIRNFCRQNLTTNKHIAAWSFHYTQLWRNSTWYRTDDGFNDGWFIKLWRYTTDLSFEIKHGTHHSQFPEQIGRAFNEGRVKRANFGEVIHYGNYGVNLRWKCIQYHNGLGGVDRHLRFEKATYAKMDKKKFPSGAEHMSFDEPQPQPFSKDQIEKILKLKDLVNLPKTFCVTISTHNRAEFLPRTLDSLIAQTYPEWIAVVVDDGSTDETEDVMLNYMEKDPRIFYVKFLEHKGGVAANEIACDIACNTAEYWTRLGSDDAFKPHKLKADFEALQYHSAIYGPFIDHDQVTGKEETIGNTPYPLDRQKECFEKQGFIAGWANFAVKTSILKQVKAKYGNYVDPSLVNMEDCLFNYRVCKITPWIWRGIFNKQFVINPSVQDMETITKNKEYLVPDAFWNMNPAGSSANSDIYVRDRQLTTKLIQKEKDL